MIKSPKKISAIVYPSLRSISYLQTISNLNFELDEIILLKSNFKIEDDFYKEYKKYGYKNFFLIEKFNEIYKKFNARVYKLHTSNINDRSVIECMKKLKNDFILFTGGGILKKEILSQGKKIIHIHPGILPYYRGSTCFYYSILDNYSIGATAFIMNQNIDTGNIIMSKKFRINYFILNEQKYFMDYVLDNYIRSNVLEIVLKFFRKQKYFKTKKNHESWHPYYIAHPLIRHLAIKKINDSYNSKSKSGIFIIEK